MFLERYSQSLFGASCRLHSRYKTLRTSLWSHIFIRNYKCLTDVLLMAAGSSAGKMSQCLDFPKTPRSSANGRSRSRRPERNGSPRRTLICALSTSARTALIRNLMPLQRQWDSKGWNWRMELSRRFSSDHRAVTAEGEVSPVPYVRRRNAERSLDLSSSHQWVSRASFFFHCSLWKSPRLERRPKPANKYNNNWKTNKVCGQ